MFEEILITALSEIDDNTLNYILESCTEDELNYIDMAIEEVSDADRDRLSSGYKLDAHNGVKGFVKSFRDSGADKWKNLAHDIGTHATRIKNNLKGDGDQVSSRLGDKDAAKKDEQLTSRLLKHRDRARNYNDLSERSNVQTESNKWKRKRDNTLNRMTEIGDVREKLLDRARQNSVDAKANNNSLSYRLGNGLKTLRNTVKSKIDAWKAKRQQNQP